MLAISAGKNPTRTPSFLKKLVVAGAAGIMLSALASCATDEPPQQPGTVLVDPGAGETTENISAPNPSQSPSQLESTPAVNPSMPSVSETDKPAAEDPCDGQEFDMSLGSAGASMRAAACISNYFSDNYGAYNFDLSMPNIDKGVSSEWTVTYPNGRVTYTLNFKTGLLTKVMG